MCALLRVRCMTTLSVFQVVVAIEGEEEVIYLSYTMVMFKKLLKSLFKFFRNYYGNIIKK